MPPENPELGDDAPVVKNRFGKTQIAGLVVSIAGAVLVLVNVGGDDNDMKAVSGGCITVLLGGLTLMAGSIIRPDNQSDISRLSATLEDGEEVDLTPEEAMEIEVLYGHDEQV